MPYPPTPSITPSNTCTPSITASQTPTYSPTETVCPGASPTITPSITASPTITPSVSLTPTFTPTNTITPSITPTNTMTPSPTVDNLCAEYQINNNTFFDVNWTGLICDSETSTGGLIPANTIGYTTCIQVGTLGYTGTPIISVDAFC